jgi:hypothetical protein
MPLPGKKTERAERMKAVEREYQVATMSLAVLEEALRKQSDILNLQDLSMADLKNFRNKLEDTYFVRLFAEFESGLRDYWKNGLGKDQEERGNTRVTDVVTSIGARLHILDSFRINAHATRKWRNKLVHDEDAEATQLTLAEGRRNLGRFFGCLPENW